jgi:cytochrome c oxidase subunit II
MERTQPMIGIKRSLLWLLSVVVFLGAPVACSMTDEEPIGLPDDDAYASNGERIYFTATNVEGEQISSEGGPGHGMMQHRFACADCHGDQGEGGRVRIMMDLFEAPAITWDALTVEHNDHGHDGHPPYTEESLKEAIREGIDPAGNRLDSRMPRYEISDDDLSDLIDYLKTLGDHNDH